MIPSAFDYLRPTSLAEAASLLAEHADEAKVLAGGQSLVPMMKLRLARPSLLIDIGRLEELHGIRDEQGTLVIGACTTHYAMESAALLRQRCPLLVETAAEVGDVQVRNRGTIGGSVAHADPAADWPAALLALDAEVTLVSSRGQRTLSVEEFVVDMLMTTLESDELLTELRLPLPPPRTGSAYLKVRQPASGFALAGVAVQVTLGPDQRIEQVAIGITGVSGKAFRARATEDAVRGQMGTEAVITAAAAQAVDEVEPLDSDLHASAEYRLHLARVYTKRALLQAIARAGS